MIKKNLKIGSSYQTDSKQRKETMRLKPQVILSATILAICPIANAGVIVNVTPVVSNSGFGAPDTSLEGFSSFAVTVSSTAGENITAIDASFTGPLHQRWADINFDGTSDQSPQGPLANNNRADSSLTPIAGAVIASAPTEDNNIGPSPLPDSFQPFVGGFDYGIGSSLSGAWGIDGRVQGESADVAYLVIPNGQSVRYSILVATSDGRVDLTGTIEVPEPASLALIGVGTLALIRRRRSA